METQVNKKLFTVQEYHRMGEAGILHPEERVELIDGEIVQMSPISYRHALCVNRANTIFIQAFGNRANVSPQSPLRLSDWSEPQPDIVVFKPRADFYATKIPLPKDVLFIVEVSDSSLAIDQKVKLPRYAAAGIPDYGLRPTNSLSAFCAFMSLCFSTSGSKRLVGCHFHGFIDSDSLGGFGIGTGIGRDNLESAVGSGGRVSVKQPGWNMDVAIRTQFIERSVP
jgi:Uma2 family endonuclease